MNARRLDHINYLAKDVVANGEFIAEALGGRESERIALDAGGYAAWWFHFNNKSYDVVYSDDWTKHGNRLHHIAFAPDTREDILKAADIFLENGIYIESGPHKHAINQTFFLYVWEPGGNRIEFANAGARLLLDPDSAGRGVDAGGAQEGPGMGHEDHRELPHPRHPRRQERALNPRRRGRNVRPYSAESVME